jgi:hypothetical protein
MWGFPCIPRTRAASKGLYAAKSNIFIKERSFQWESSGLCEFLVSFDPRNAGIAFMTAANPSNSIPQANRYKK